MQGPEFQIVNLDQHLGLPGGTARTGTPPGRPSAPCTLTEADLLMRAKLKNKGDLAGVSSSPQWRSAQTLPPGRQGGCSYCGIGMVHAVPPRGSYLIGPIWSAQKPRMPVIAWLTGTAWISKS